MRPVRRLTTPSPIAAAHGSAALVCATILAAAAMPVAATAAEQAPLAVELNKLEPFDKGCRLNLVLTNPGTPAYPTIKLDLVMFDPSGVIGRRIAIDVGPVRATKKSVKQFDIDGIACDRIASVLVNDVIECKSDNGPVVDCLARMTFSSVAGTPLSK